MLNDLLDIVGCALCTASIILLIKQIYLKIKTE